MDIAVVQDVFSDQKYKFLDEELTKIWPLKKLFVFSLIINATKCLFDASTGVAEFASKFFVAAADVDVGSEQVRP